MNYSKLSVAYFAALFLIALSPVSAQETSFDHMVNEKMMEFTNRDVWQKSDTLMLIMQIAPTDKIAEIGAGEGYFTLKLAQQVGPDGLVIALDTDGTKLNKLRLLKRYAKLEQIEIKQNNPDDLGLAPASLDKIVMMDSYHELPNYQDILAQCAKALKPGGKLIIIDRCEAKIDNDKSSRKKLAKKQSIRVSMVEEDLNNAGFTTYSKKEKYTVQNRRINWFVIAASK